MNVAECAALERMQQPVSLIIQTMVGVLMIMFSILARGKIKKPSES